MGNLGFSEFSIMLVSVGPVVVLAGWLILTVLRLRTEVGQLRTRVAALEADRR